jgi:Ca2+-binding RTX toxin-like protein
VSVQLEPGDSTLKVVGSAIWLNSAACGEATTASTDSITVTGAAGTTENLTIDQSGGAFAPGATAETGTGALSEIEFAVNLGDAMDRIVVLGTAGDDTLAAGTIGIALNSDADVDLGLAVQPAVLELQGGGGQNTLTGRGGNGSGTTYSGRLVLRAGDLGDTLRGGLANDDVHGGAGADTLEGREGNDLVLGGGGNDSLAGSTGDDDMSGGAGLDSLAGSDGNDILRADDDEADTTISGGPGTDTAYYDLGIDPNPAAVENKLPS